MAEQRIEASIFALSLLRFPKPRKAFPIDRRNQAPGQVLLTALAKLNGKLHSPRIALQLGTLVSMEHYHAAKHDCCSIEAEKQAIRKHNIA